MRYSEQQAFGQCPYRYKLQTDGVKKNEDGKSAHHKNWGAAWHKGAEMGYNMMKDGVSPSKEFEVIRKEFLSLYPTSLDPHDQVKTVESGVLSLKKYFDQYEARDKEQWEVIATELEGLIEIDDEEHGLHIDLVARNRQTQEVYGFDHKTSKNTPNWKACEIDSQITRYTSYIQEQFGQCAGFIINHVQLGHIGSKDESGRNTYMESNSFNWHYWENQEFGYSKYHKMDMTVVWGAVGKFERQMFNRTPEQIRFWNESDMNWMKMIEFCKREGVWPRALNKMCAYCDYYDLCLASGDEQIKELLYNKNNEEFNVEVK